MTEVIAVTPATFGGMLVTHAKGDSVSKMIAPDLQAAYRIAGQWLRAEWWKEEEGNC